MSRTYRIVVKEALARHARVADGLVSSLELLPLLPPERLETLLGEALVGCGFERRGAVLRRCEPLASGGGELVVEIDPRSGAVALAVEAHEALVLAEERSTVSTVEGCDALEAGLVAAARGALEARGVAAEEALRRRATAALEGRLPGLSAELDALVTRVTAAALRERAAELGEIDSVVEQGDGGVTIRVRV